MWKMPLVGQENRKRKGAKTGPCSDWIDEDGDPKETPSKE